MDERERLEANAAASVSCEALDRRAVELEAELCALQLQALEDGREAVSTLRDLAISALEDAVLAYNLWSKAKSAAESGDDERARRAFTALETFQPHQEAKELDRD